MKWQDDSGFIRWLISSEYAEYRGSKVYPYLSGGCVLYCWEAYRAGKSVNYAMS